MLPEPHCRKQSQRAVRGSQEKRSCCNEQPKAHAPEMPRDALCSKNTAAHKHANVPRGSKQTYGTHEKHHAGGNSTLRARSATQDFNTIHPQEDTEGQGKQKRDPIKTARFPVSAPGGQPCRSDQING